MKPKSRVAPTKAKPGIKFDATKLRYDLLPPVAIDQLMAVMTFGAAKYGPENWRQVADPDGRYLAAAMRHLMRHQAARKGVKGASKFDKETALLDLSHALTCIAFLIEKELDSLLTEEEVAALIEKAEKARAGAK